MVVPMTKNEENRSMVSSGEKKKKNNNDEFNFGNFRCYGGRHPCGNARMAQCHLTRYYSLIRYYQSNPGESMMIEKINMTVVESQKRGEIKFKRKEK